jgi:hypothetical protein
MIDWLGGNTIRKFYTRNKKSWNPQTNSLFH